MNLVRCPRELGLLEKMALDRTDGCQALEDGK